MGNIIVFIALQMKHAYQKCLKPCEETTYKDSVAKMVEPIYLKEGNNTALFDVFMTDPTGFNVRRVEKEVLVVGEVMNQQSGHISSCMHSKQSTKLFCTK